ncbi:39S ribosomal protein L20, mitochondrial-like [Scleropages formosus]|uniref:Large ribosomal subunit protein bL20m n=1 Tax=Scleropages formosus TaxID=113540 RepID=A0A0P7UGM4_SCLFO|nr:39S ribosomal protein L20, mitochondrial-like [Scleropages formosus]
MVFLTLSRWIRNRGPDRWWRVQEVLKHARHFRGRKNRCFRLALWISRIAAGTREHGMKYPVLVCNLVKTGVEVNRRVLCDLAITEPRSFQSLVALAKARREEGLRDALGDGKEPPGVFSRIVQSH